MTPIKPWDVVVVGAGLSGLAAAWSLTQQGLSVAVLEANPSVGGMIGSVEEEGYLMELGPNSFPSSSEALLSLAESVGLQPVSASPLNKTRYIWKEGALRQVPGSPVQAITTPLLSPKAKLSILGEPFREPLEEADPTVEDWVSYRLGPEVLNNFVAPFLTGIYAGDPAKLSISAIFPSLIQLEREHGSLIKGAFAKLKQRRQEPRKPKRAYTLYNFEGGLQQLPIALAGALPENCLRLGQRVLKIQQEVPMLGSPAHWRLETLNETLFAKALLLSTPAHVNANLLEQVIPEAVEPSLAIPYAPVTVAQVAVPLNQLSQPLDGFGFLVPRGEGLRLLGCIWSSALFPERAPEGQALVTAFYGGMQDTGIPELEEETFHELVRTELSQTLAAGLPLEPTFIKTIHWRQAIPQYNVGHQQRVERLQQALADSAAPIAVAGNYLNSINLNGCVESAFAAVANLRQHFPKHNKVELPSFATRRTACSVES